MPSGGWSFVTGRSRSAAESQIRARHASPLRVRQSGPVKRSLGAIVGSIKSACTKRINELRGTPGLPAWQRNYHERVIRDDEELDILRNYILLNPVQWENDEENPDLAGRSVCLSPLAAVLDFYCR